MMVSMIVTLFPLYNTTLCASMNGMIMMIPCLPARSDMARADFLRRWSNEYSERKELVGLMAHSGTNKSREALEEVM